MLKDLYYWLMVHKLWTKMAILVHNFGSNHKHSAEILWKQLLIRFEIIVPNVCTFPYLNCIAFHAQFDKHFSECHELFRASLLSYIVRSYIVLSYIVRSYCNSITSKMITTMRRMIWLLHSFPRQSSIHFHRPPRPGWMIRSRRRPPRAGTRSSARTRRFLRTGSTAPRIKKIIKVSDQKDYATFEFIF